MRFSKVGASAMITIENSNREKRYTQKLSPSSRLPNVSMIHIINIIAVGSPLVLQLDATILVIVIVIFHIRTVIVVVASFVDRNIFIIAVVVDHVSAQTTAKS